MKITFRSKQKMSYAAAGFLSATIVAIGVGYWGYDVINHSREKELLSIRQQLSEAEAQLAIKKEQLEQAWALKTDMKAGDPINEADLISIDQEKSKSPQNLILTKGDIVGKRLKIALKQNTPIVDTMLFQDGVTPNDLRSQILSVFNLESAAIKDDFLDIRIKFPTGENFIVLSKKKIYDLQGKQVTLQMNEQEILTMTSAIVDAYLNYAQLYAVSYVDPYMQDAAITTYPPNQHVIDLIKTDPNIVKRATMQLEKLQRQNLEANLKAMDDTEKQRAANGQAAAAASSSTGNTQDNGSTTIGGGSNQSTVKGSNAAAAAPQSAQPVYSASPVPQSNVGGNAPTPLPANATEDKSSILKSSSEAGTENP